MKNDFTAFFLALPLCFGQFPTGARTNFANRRFSLFNLAHFHQNFDFGQLLAMAGTLKFLGEVGEGLIDFEDSVNAPMMLAYQILVS